MKYLWFRILFSPPFSYSQSGQGTVGGDLSYYASDQMEPGLHSNSLITLRAASVKKIDGAMENCIAMLPKQKLDSRFKRSGPLPIMDFFSLLLHVEGVYLKSLNTEVILHVSNFIPRFNTGLELLSYLHLIMGSYAPIYFTGAQKYQDE